MASVIQRLEDQVAEAFAAVTPSDTGLADAFLTALHLSGEHALFSDEAQRVFMLRLARTVAPDSMDFVPTASKHLYEKLFASQFPRFKDDVETLNCKVADVLAEIFYSTSRPERFQLFNHLSAAEVFFVELDSLLLEVVANSNVRIDLVQTLHLVYAAEALLQKFISRGGKLHVVCFRAHAQFYASSPQLGIARAVLVQRLQTAALNHGFHFKEFDSWTSDGKHSYGEYQLRHQPEFVMVNDCEQVAGPAPAEYAASSGDSQPLLGDVEKGTLATSVLRIFMTKIVGLRTHVVFTSRLVFKDNDILGFVLRAHSHRFVPLARCLGLLRSSAGAKLSGEVPEAIEINDFVASVKKTADKNEVKFASREYVILPALASVLGEDDSVRSLVKAHIITLALTSELPMASRCLPRIESAAVSQYCASVAKEATPLALSVDGVLSVDEKFCDMLDGQLIAHVARQLQVGSALEDQLDETTLFVVEVMWQWVSKQAGLKKQPLQPIELNVETSLVEASSGQQPNVHGLSHPLVKEMLKRCDVAGLALSHAPESNPLRETALASHEDFATLDMPAGVREEEERLKTFDQLPPRERKKQMKARGGFINAARLTAESMGVTAFLSANESLNKTASAAADEQRAKAAQKKSWSKPKRGAKMSEAERIKKENSMKRASDSIASTLKQFNNVCGELMRNSKSLSIDLAALDRFIKNSVEARVDDSDSDDDHDTDKDRAMWEHIVGSSVEADFVLNDTRTINVKAILAKIDEYIKAQQLALKNKAQALLTEGDDDAALRLKSLFFSKFTQHIRAKALFEALRLARKLWVAELGDARTDGREVNRTELIPMFQRLQLVLDHVQRNKIVLSSDDRKEMRECALLTGFGQEYEELVNAMDNEFEGKTYQATHTVEHIDRPALGSSHTPSRFQLEYMGHLLQRPISRTDDHRVPFGPDPWQVDLLDIVDRNGSAVVCAPTSAGKTFISYYCMKRVLRESDDNVVVYVCPTRALINQALADVYGRYGHKSYEFSGHNVFGCLGGAEYVNRPFKCQVLVTLPETFEAILLAPRYQAWSKKIRYVIFDEIHSIDSTGNGDVWERLLMLVRCPFVALSATLGATEPILTWLNGVQRKIEQQSPDPSRDYNVHLVPKSGTKINRWSDIQKYAFMPSEISTFTKTTATGNAAADQLLQVHPMSAVTLEMLREKFPEDLPFVPSESLSVYDTLVSIFATHLKPVASNAANLVKTHLKRLKPEKYFAGRRFVTQSEARAYEQELKAVLLEMGQFSSGEFTEAAADEDESVAPRISKASTHALNDLLSRYEDVVKGKEVSALQAADSGAIAYPDTFKFVQQHMLNLLIVLRAKNLLPTIAFSFEESDCHDLVEYVVSQLENAEAEYRQTREFREWSEERERKRKIQEERMARAAKGTARVRETDEDGKVSVREDEVATVDEVEDFSIPDVLPAFSFRAESTACLDPAEIADIERLPKWGGDLAYRAIKRGIGMHTPDMNGKLRVRIERLFRLKFLPVVFATEGLALGIHSPCRSVVLAGDHVHLNTSQFRQMAGRAGRRGLDFLGHVIFLGVSQAKMQRLLTSDLATLKGHVHIDPVVELRLQQMYDYVPERDEAPSDPKLVANLSECLLSRPLFYHGNNSCPDYRALEVRHLAVTLGLLSQGGFVNRSNPSSIGCLVTRAMNTFKEAKAGAGSIMFGMLLARGFFHDLARVWAAGGEARVNAFDHVLKILCYLLTVDRDNNVPLEMHRSILSDPTVFDPFPDNAATCPHDVILPGIRKLAGQRFGDAVSHISQYVTKVYAQMLATYADANELQAETALPFAHKNRSPGAKALGESPLAAALDGMKLNVKVRSPFVALSGSGDTFSCTDDLLSSLRSGLFLDVAHIPCLDFRDVNSRRGDQILINAAIVDFIAEGSQFVDGAPRRHYLEKFNGLRQDKSWYTLNRFMTIISNTLRSFKNDEEKEPCLLGKDATDPVFEVLEEVVAQLGEHAAQISFKFQSKKAFDEQQQLTAKNRKAKRPALGKEIRRRRR